MKETRLNKTNIDRLTADNAALILIDHNIGTGLSIESVSRQTLVNNVIALAKVGKLFKLPIVLTNGGQDSDPSAILYPQLMSVLNDVPIIRRQSTFNSWDDSSFVAAVKATGRKNLIMAGIWTEVCLLFPALSALSEGYEVYPVVDACAGESAQTEQAAIQRMIQGGARPATWFSVGSELQQSWANLATKEKFAEIAVQHLAGFGTVINYYNHFQQDKDA